MKTMFLKFSKEVKGLIFASIILSSITTMSFIGLMALSAYLIVLSAFHPSIAALQIVIVGVRFFGISRSVFRYLERLMSHSANLRILKNIRVYVFQQIAKNFPFNLPGKTSYELLGFLIQDIEFLENLFVRIILPIISTLFVIIIVSLFFSAFSYELILVAILGFIMVGVVLPLISAKHGSVNSKKLVKARSSYQNQLLSFFQHFQESLIYYQNEKIISKIQVEEKSFANTHWKIHISQSLFSGLSNLLVQLIAITGIWVSLSLIQKNRLDIIFVAVFYLIFLSMYESIQNLSMASNMMSELDSTLTRLDKISVNQEKINGKLVETRNELLPIKIQNVSFRFDSSEKNAIENINITIHKNEKIAIVGRNGSGKTTFLDLLSGFYDNFSGQILYGSNEIRSLDKESFRLHLSYVNGSPYIFSTSIMKNLILANPDCSEGDINKILQVMKLDTRFLSVIDHNLTEQGKNISSGEKQKIEIGRCLLRKSDLILLDEPLSNIDPIFMNEISQMLHSFFVHKTVIWVTHQFINMQYFDKIIVFDLGSIIEEGSHYDLLSKKGAYYKLVSGI